MSEQKSKLPDLNELGSIASKLFKDVKNSVTEIVQDYKKKREDTKVSSESVEKPAKKSAKKSADDSKDTKE